MNPKTIEELNAYIDEQLAVVQAAGDAESGYNAAAAFARDVATAAFNYAAHRQGLTGFQASWAVLAFTKEALNIKGPLAIIDADQMLYPQYPTPSEKAREYEERWRPALADMAEQKLAEHNKKDVAPAVWEHWRKLADYKANDVEGEE